MLRNLTPKTVSYLSTATSPYVKWEDEITTILQNNLEITRSDAQAMVEANELLMNNFWINKTPPSTVAWQISNL